MEICKLEHWLALCHLPGMSPALCHRLLEEFSQPEAVLKCNARELAAAGLNPALLAGLREYQHSPERSATGQKVLRDLAWREGEGQYLISLDDPAYPPLLKAIPCPPPLLYVRGEPQTLRQPMLAMVGSRSPSAGGRRLAQRFAGQLSQQGYAIASGLALGIDRESHRGVLEQGGTTVAVLGTGVDRLYPARNRHLAQHIVERGALVSEFPLGTPPLAWHFPRRNRIISGLSQGVLVVEAAQRSGSLITANFALEQGRDVFALPGSLDNPRTGGCHLLIKSGAKLVETVDDILEELPPLTRDRRSKCLHQEDESVSHEQRLAPPELDVFKHIGFDCISFDALQALCGISAGSLSAALVQLELLGAIESVAGGYTRRTP